MAAVSLRLAAEGFAQRHPQVHLVDADAEPVGQRRRAPRRHAPRPCTTARSGGSRGSARSAASGPRPPAAAARPTACRRRSWRAAAPRSAAAARASIHGLQHQRIGLVGQRVSGFGAGQPADRTDVAGHHGARGPLLLAERERQRADPLVLVVVLVAVRPCPLPSRRTTKNGPTREPSRRALWCRRTPGPG